MLANIEPSHGDFHSLANYLIHGRDRPTHPDRVAWIMAQNLASTDPLVAAKLMAATAQMSRRCTSPCYHVSINWHPDEQPSPEMMQDVARRTLILAGLGEHEALAMGHGDKPHRHLHLMINRVHPESGRAWATSHDYRRFDRIMRQLSDEYGFEYVPAHSFDPEATEDLVKAPPSNARYAAKRGAQTNRPQWSARQSREFGATLSEKLDRAAAWDDVSALLADHGLELEAKGRGHVVGDGASYTKLSALGLTGAARDGLLRYRSKAAATSTRYRRERSTANVVRPSLPTHALFDVDAVDIARAIGTKADVRHAVNEALRARKARLSNKPVLDQLMSELVEQWRASTTLKPSSPKPTRRKSPAIRKASPTR